MESNFVAEIEDVHRFLTDWLNGSAARSEEVYAPFAEALDEGFLMISPDGRQTARDDVLSAIEAAHGGRGEDFKIWIERPSLIARLPSHVMGTYEEWQSLDDVTAARVSTVIFRRDNARPNGLRWAHLHETWLPGHAPPAA